MKFYRKLKISVQAGITNLLDHVENHEAAANALLAEARGEIAKAETRAGRLRAQHGKLVSSHGAAREKAESWRRRALEVKDDDRALALECVRRLELAEAEATEWEEALHAHEASLKQVEAELDKARRRVDELMRRRNTLSARQSCAGLQSEVLTGVEDSELNSLFERWEERVRVSEMSRSGGCGEVVEPVERAFLEKEKEAALEVRLAKLEEVNGEIVNREDGK